MWTGWEITEVPEARSSVRFSTSIRERGRSRYAQILAVHQSFVTTIIPKSSISNAIIRSTIWSVATTSRRGCNGTAMAVISPIQLQSEKASRLAATAAAAAGGWTAPKDELNTSIRVVEHLKFATSAID